MLKEYVLPVSFCCLLCPPNLFVDVVIRWLCKMYESPNSLQDVCLDYICENISALCEPQVGPDGEPSESLAFRSDDVFFHGNLSDKLLSCLKTRPLTMKGMRMLRAHNLIELEAIGLKNMTVNDLIGCLGEWSLANLHMLNVSSSTFVNSAKFSVVVSLSKLRNLHSLNVSHTEFNELGLEIVVEDLKLLKNLNISDTHVKDLCPLRKCKDRLQSLSLYKLRVVNSDMVVPVLCELTNIRHLDVSDDFSYQEFLPLQPVKFKVADLLHKTREMPHLTSLDISGKAGIEEEALKQFLKAHPKLRFLGLALTTVCSAAMFTEETSDCSQPHLTVAGEATEAQLVEALRRYSTEKRPTYIQRSLYNLFNYTRYYDQPRTDIIRLILLGVEEHPMELGVQMAATACLYNLSLGEMGQKVHPYLLSRIIHCTLNAMENFPNHQQLQKNALLTLCSDRILHDVTFDRFRCAKLVMECLCSFDDASMNRMSVAICGILAAKIPSEQTSRLGAKQSYMNKLLTIVRGKADNQSVDITMKFTLSALWNLTDESPLTCELFLNEGGLELFLEVLQRYKDMPNEDRVQVETKVLGLINNLAEVGPLRPRLMRVETLTAVRELLWSSHIDVSYFAAGIISHLVSDADSTWTIEEFTQQEILEDLGEAVKRWDQPQGEMVAYRSFSPFFPLLEQFETPEVQLWAIWAMQHVCMKNGTRYGPMLIREGGASILRTLANDPRTDPVVAKMAIAVLHLIEQELRSI
ncbi:hypothetical protein NP493_43g02052 [Ridgeia piscesae]|uniref:Uncharacterized protein n=1 Tax=Ridgeia piscesae TaxID=27915 RepID=A0AAD9PC92_RIDPI|nr:hypothetical protein NP493_43g02052 [Ridgeia piscesae]